MVKRRLGATAFEPGSNVSEMTNEPDMPDIGVIFKSKVEPGPKRDGIFEIRQARSRRLPGAASAVLFPTFARSIKPEDQGIITDKPVFKIRMPCVLKKQSSSRGSMRDLNYFRKIGGNRMFTCPRSGIAGLPTLEWADMVAIVRYSD